MDYVIIKSGELDSCNWLDNNDLISGQIGQSASSMASIMVDAACEFYKTKRPKSLKEIVVCIFQDSMLDEFVDAVASKGASRSFMNRAAGYQMFISVFHHYHAVLL